MTELYLAHPYDFRHGIRDWELYFEEKTGIQLINPFYELFPEETFKRDKGILDRYAQTDPHELVKKEVQTIKLSDGIVSVVCGGNSIGTLMEMVYAKNFKKEVYSIVMTGQEKHPWLSVHSSKIFTNFQDFEGFISNV